MNGFNAVKLKTHIFRRDFTDKSSETSVVRFVKTAVSAAGITPVKFYNACGDVYAYCSDRTLKKAVNGAFVNTGFTSDAVPLIAPVIYNGNSAALFIGDGTASVGGVSVSGVPYGSDCAFFGGRLFIADGNAVRFSEEFDFTDFTVGLSFGGYIKVGKECGDVLHFAADGGKLYVICEKGIYALAPYGNQYDFTMEKVSAFALDVKADSVFTVGNRTCFLSGDAFCVLCGGKVKKTGKEDFSGFTAKTAGGTDGVYVLSLISDGTEYVYVYDTVSGKETLMIADGFSVSGGYAVNLNDGYLYTLNVRTETATLTTEISGEYDFGTCRKKAVSKVETHIRGSATLTVRGDVVFRAAVSGKCNSVPCFVHGRNFYIGFENASADFKAYNIAVHYTIYGE
ncbi:MAG: hypothetical protein J6Y43_00020 [Clostridia bacterium]|nr:hypothetical protein [Clostridia bacterium]